MYYASPLLWRSRRCRSALGEATTIRIGRTLLLAAVCTILGFSSAEARGQEPPERESEQESAPARPPRTRAELLERRRIAKRGERRPYEPTGIERALLRLDKGESTAIQDINVRGLYPRIVWPSRGSGAALGARYWQPDFLGPVDLAGSAFYSLRDYQHYDLQVGLMPHVGRQLPGRSWKGDDVYELGDLKRAGLSRLTLYGTFRYRYLPQEDYFGAGPDSKASNRTNYLLEETLASARAGYQFSNHVLWGVDVGALSYSLGSGRSGRFPSIEQAFDDSTAPGLTDPPDYFRYGSELLLDFRDEPGNPHRGGMVALGAQRYHQRRGESFQFTRYALDARGFVPLGSRQRVLALRTLAILDEADSGQRVPFFVQESLGGSHTLRGFDSFRFRGDRVLLYQAEYRWEASPFWDFAIFTDAGTVGEAGRPLRHSNLEWDYGAGFRIKSYRDVLVRIEVAWSRETTRYFLRTSTSF